ncbi:hypothetical protein L1887_17929 [Cichorium endivia]|nr:hypothetical protein L1887_17929 [Cichorium endivia]
MNGLDDEDVLMNLKVIGVQISSRIHFCLSSIKIESQFPHLTSNLSCDRVFLPGLAFTPQPLSGKNDKKTDAVIIEEAELWIGVRFSLQSYVHIL